jgi:hypothetical protein
MLLDELETRLRGDSGEMLRGVLDSGFRRGGKLTICVGDQHEEKDFSTFCPKVLAGIGRVWDTVASRSIPVRMARASRAELVLLKKLRGDRIVGICLPYRRRLQRWASDFEESLRALDPETPDSLGARHSDVWRPLLGIADVAGGEWPKRARDAALELHGRGDEESDYGLLLLADVRELFDVQKSEPFGEKLRSAKIVEELVKREDRPWPEYRNERPITPRGVANLLARFDIRPKTIRIGLETTKGYERADFVAAFRTYLEEAHTPPHSTVTTVTPATRRTEDGGEELTEDGRRVGRTILARIRAANHGLGEWVTTESPCAGVAFGTGQR